PTMTRFNGSQSFQELTIFAMTVSFLRGIIKYRCRFAEEVLFLSAGSPVLPSPFFHGSIVRF
ncbi:hypothetical protein, partial [uncultured Senegalimassilia sp.]|uniref:hypothetical protein n=1 Tax=uncultured Senegalimassilia sp. TaxID=1714350 RepID=UPI0026002443